MPPRNNFLQESPKRFVSTREALRVFPTAHYMLIWLAASDLTGNKKFIPYPCENGWECYALVSSGLAIWCVS